MLSNPEKETFLTIIIIHQVLRSTDSYYLQYRKTQIQCLSHRLIVLLAVTTNWCSSFTTTLGSDIYWTIPYFQNVTKLPITHANIGEGKRDRVEHSKEK
jgi:hypothetical protein